MDDPSLRKVVVNVKDIDLPWRSVFRLTLKFMIAAAVIYGTIMLVVYALMISTAYLRSRDEKRESREPRESYPSTIEIGSTAPSWIEHPGRRSSNPRVGLQPCLGA
jgi:hypothetical protein